MRAEEFTSLTVAELYNMVEQSDERLFCLALNGEDGQPFCMLALAIDQPVVLEEYAAALRQLKPNVLTDAMRLQQQPESGMPLYQCHKRVSALRIAKIEHEEGDDAGAIFTPTEDGHAPFHVDHQYLVRHQPQVGGYYVVYEDGYRSYSPAAAFESGYRRIVGSAH
jgi:hypothetical protein